MPVPPNPLALRRDRSDDPAWTTLKPRDPDAAVPDFPLDAPTPRELHWWDLHWRMPQANEWARRGEEITVALFVRVLAQAEQPNAAVTIHRPLKQLRDELGISVDGARRRRWLLPTDPAVSNARPASLTPIDGGAKRARPASTSSAKQRFRTVHPTEETSA
jgi:hypothetical protein